MNKCPSLPFCFAFLFLVSLCCPLSSVATNTVVTNRPTILPGVTVIGTNVTKSLTSPSLAWAAQQYQQIPGGFALKSAADMQKGRASNFQDLLALTPGVFMQSENGMEISKVSIRGSGIESDDEPLGVEFLMDGISFDQGDGETIIEDFDVDTLKYAEVYRGADALKYGALTIGGAINLVPYTGYDADPIQARFEAGSYGFMRSQVSSGGVDGPFDYYTSASERQRDGYRANSREDTELWFGDFGYRINDHLENRVYLTVNHTDRKLPGGLTPDQFNEDPRQADPDATTNNYSKKWYYGRIADKLSYVSDGHELNASAYWWHRELEEKGYYATNDFSQGIQDYHADDAGMDFNTTIHSILLGQQNIFTAGITPAMETEQDHNWENIGGQKGNTIARDAELSVNVPLYAQNQHYLTDKLSLITGFQAMYALRHFYDDFDSDVVGVQSAKQYFVSINPKVGLLYEITPNSQAYLNFSRSWQPPSFDNMVDFNQFDNGNQGLSYTPLQPQYAWTVEIGTRGHHGRFDWDLSLYHSWVRNELLDLYNPIGDSDIGDVNIAKSMHQGIEAGLDTELWNSSSKPGESGQRLSFDQTYTLNDFRFVNDPNYGNNRIGGIPVHVYDAELMYENPCGFYAGPNVSCNFSSYPVDQENTLYANSYVLLGFKAGYNFTIGKSRFSVFFEAKNLTDKLYAASVDPIGGDGDVAADAQVLHPGDGRSYYAGLTWSW